MPDTKEGLVHSGLGFQLYKHVWLRLLLAMPHDGFPWLPSHTQKSAPTFGHSCRLVCSPLCLHGSKESSPGLWHVRMQRFCAAVRGSKTPQMRGDRGPDQVLRACNLGKVPSPNAYRGWLRNPSRTALKPWLKPLFVGTYRGN